jgi:hypothetical protein
MLCQRSYVSHMLIVHLHTHSEVAASKLGDSCNMRHDTVYVWWLVVTFLMRRCKHLCEHVP